MPTKVHLVKAIVFPVVMYGCESWTVKKIECQRIGAFELWCWRRLLTVPWIVRRSNQSIPKGDQSWVFFRRTNAKGETPVLWPPHVKSWLIGKDPEAGRDWGQEEKGTTEDEMGGWHHWLNGREFERTPGDGDGQGGLVYCNSWGSKESDTTERLNWTELNKNSDPGIFEWRRKWKPTLVFLPGKSHVQSSLVGYSPWVAKSQTQLSMHTCILLKCGIRWV